MKTSIRSLLAKLRRLTGESEPPQKYALPSPPSPIVRHGQMTVVVMPASDDMNFFGQGLRTRDCQLCEAYVWDLGTRHARVICPRCAYQLGLDEAQVKRSVSVQLAARW